jgi:hypothetical protein
MNNLFISYIVAAIIALFACITGAAQTHVDQQFKRFDSMIKSGNITATSMQNVTYHNGDMTTGSCTSCEFKIEHGSNIVKDIVSAMNRDENAAYHSASSTAGNQSVTYAIAYGNGKNDYVLIGDNPKRNFKVVCFKDNKNNDYRISYAIEWEQDNKGNYTGKLCKVFGMKPDKMISSNNREINVSNIDTLISSNNLNALSKLKDLRNLNLNGNGYTLNLKEYLNGNHSSWDDDENWPLDDEDANDIASEWLTEFGLYCNKFKEKAKQSASNGIVYATEILKLCKRASGILDKDEKKLCIETLKDCKGYSKDKFIIGLLDQAISHLKGKHNDESYFPSHLNRNHMNRLC